MPIIDSHSFEAGLWRTNFEFGFSTSFANDEAVLFLNAVSRAILTDKEARSYPDLVTLGYFCRRANLERAIADTTSISSRFGWGTVVHIAPSNIPLNFAFSFVMGLLAGNSNIVRLPSRPFAQSALCVKLIDRLLCTPEFERIGRSICFVQSDRDSEALKGLISNAAGLIVWGGNETVQYFRTLPKLPRCVEVYFPDRVSSLLVDVSGYLALSDAEALSSARRFFNDTYHVDQNACSSPNIVFWLGEDARIEDAQRRFWSLLEPIVNSEYTMDPTARIDRALDIFRNVVAVKRSLTLNSEHGVWRLTDPEIRGLPLRFGTFLELSIGHVRELLDYLRPNEQTLTTLGISPVEVFSQLREVGSIPRLDRIVPVGSALDISFNWDGKEVLSVLSRKVQCG